MNSVRRGPSDRYDDPRRTGKKKLRNCSKIFFLPGRRKDENLSTRAGKNDNES